MRGSNPGRMCARHTAGFLGVNPCLAPRSVAALVYIARWAPWVLLPGSVAGLVTAAAAGAVLGALALLALLVSGACCWATGLQCCGAAAALGAAFGRFCQQQSPAT
jgi:hypothetical protein